SFARASVTDRLEIYSELLPELERLSVAYVVQALSKLGLVWRAGTRIDRNSLSERLQVTERRTRVLQRLFELLEQHRLCSRHAEFIELHDARGAEPTVLAESISQRFGQQKTELALLERCGGQLAAVLRDQCDPLELLAPKGDTSLIQSLYEQTAPARV